MRFFLVKILLLLKNDYSCRLRPLLSWLHSLQRIRPHSTPPISFGSPNYDDLRETPEYHAALEFELWRANEEAKFTAHLKQREQNIMTTLAEEWHKRDNQREIIYRRKVSVVKHIWLLVKVTESVTVCSRLGGTRNPIVVDRLMNVIVSEVFQFIPRQTEFGMHSFISTNIVADKHRTQ